jgi:hypothetical protein
VLLREQRRRDEDRALAPVLERNEGRAHGDLGLAEAHVAADEAIHRLRGAHVAEHLLDGLVLVRRLVEGEGRLEERSSRSSTL